MPKYLVRLGGHVGFAMVKLADGELAETAPVTPGRAVAHVAVCWSADEPGSPHWYGPTEYPPTEAGERAAVEEWQQLHARVLLMSPAPTGVGLDVATMINRLDTLSIESPLAMIAELDRVRRRTEALLVMTVENARSLGTSWTVIGASLGISREAAQDRFHGPRPD